MPAKKCASVTYKLLPWVVAAVSVAVAVWAWGERGDAVSDADAARAALSARDRLDAETQRRITRQAELEGQLRNGGQDDLSDYMLDAGRKLWP